MVIPFLVKGALPDFEYFFQEWFV